MVKKSKVKVGMLFETNKCGDILILDFVNAHDVTVKFFNTGTELKSSTSAILNGRVSDPYAPLMKGIGWCGRKYPTKDKNGKGISKEYNTWAGMFDRCYGNHKSSDSYSRKCVTVAPEFHSYEDFYEFFTKLPNAYEDGWQLDKDLFFNGTYSPESVCMLPSEINVAMTFSDSRKFLNTFPGVKKNGDRFSARYRKNDVEHYIGSFGTEKEAFDAYSKAKHDWVCELAEKYKEKLPENVFDALMNWYPTATTYL